jgi:DNA-directed RNA polymerase specialized sigma24 family protein
VVASDPRATDVDVARFERSWSANYAAVHAHAERRVGADADEVCAEVFLVAWRRFDELPRDALPWLLATSRNVIGTLWRGRIAACPAAGTARRRARAGDRRRAGDARSRPVRGAGAARRGRRALMAEEDRR